MEIDKDELLVKIKDTLKGEVSSISYDTWISSLGIKSIDDNNIVFTTLSEYQRDFIENRFKDLLFNTIKYITNKEYTFSVIDLSKKDKDGNELFLGREKYAIFRDLGLFLFMYLGNGQNLADTLRLTYDELYYATHGKQLRFLRHKTRERNESASEVIFPVTPEIQEILNRYGNVPKLGRRVFPIMSELITPEQEIWVIQRYNRYIREHMAKVAKLLDMEQVPSPTWARHSFATNLNNSGVVPYKYISDSMGHSGGGDITSNYIGAYPLAKMLEYNHYLLNEKSKESTPVVDKKALLEMLKGLSEEERTELMANLSD